MSPAKLPLGAMPATLLALSMNKASGGAASWRALHAEIADATGAPARCNRAMELTGGGAMISFTVY